MAIEHVSKNELKFKNPERLLILVLAFIAWSIGFIDLLGHTSQHAVVFGLYSVPFFALIVLHGAGLVFLVVLFASPKILSRVLGGLEYVQSRTWSAVLVLGLLGFMLWFTFAWERWPTFSGLQLSLLLLTLLAILVFILFGLRQHRREQRWRKVIGVPLAILFSVEIILQIAAFFGDFPGNIRNDEGLFTPYGRVYQNEEGLANSISNSYGWYYPEFKLEPESKRVLMVGDTFVQGLQVRPDQNMGVVLEALINQSKTSTAPTEVFSLGHPGFGPGLYLDVPLIEYSIEFFQPDEIVVYIHLGNDFQTTSGPSDDNLYFIVDEHGKVEIDPASGRLLHALQHYVLSAYEPPQPVRTLESHYLSGNLLKGLIHDGINSENADQIVKASEKIENNLEIPQTSGFIHKLGGRVEDHSAIRSIGLSTTTGTNNFIFDPATPERAQEAMAIVFHLLDGYHELLRSKGITLHLVTIPVFPRAFFTEYQDTNWEPEIEGYDLYLPEKKLRDFARTNNIAMLPMGQYMYEQKLTVNEIKELYYSNGQGHFTPEGHRYFANALFTCFFVPEQQDRSASCPVN